MAKLIRIKRQDGSFYPNWYSDIRIGGKRIHRALSKFKPVAQKMLDEMKDVARAKRHGETPKEMSWPFFTRFYLDYRKNKNVDPKTIRKDQVAIRLAERCTTLTRLSDMTPEKMVTIQARAREFKVAESVITRSIHSLKHMMRTAENLKYVPLQNWRIVETRKSPARLDYYDFASFEKLLSFFGGMWRTAILLMGRAGLRVGEVYHLEWQDIQFDIHQICFTSKPHLKWKVKGDKHGTKKRIVPLDEALEAHLKSLPRASTFVLGEDRPRSLELFYHRIQNAIIASGVKTHLGKYGSPHVLRHSFATHLVSNKTTLEEIAEFLGHNDITTTQIYAHLMPHAQAKAIKNLPKLLFRSSTAGPSK